MSRSAFAASFRALVGEPPMAYLRRWRMTLARNLLEREDSTLLAIADQLGYGSEAAFNKAFKQAVGIAPGAYRRGRATRLPSLNRN
jgi:AraC-like DNA-binding protein